MLSRHCSKTDEGLMASLFDDPVPVWEEVLASGPIPRPRQAAVSRPVIDASPRRPAAMSATIASRAM